MPKTDKNIIGITKFDKNGLLTSGWKSNNLGTKKNINGSITKKTIIMVIFVKRLIAFTATVPSSEGCLLIKSIISF